jgi:hypothetical protein
MDCRHFFSSLQSSYVVELSRIFIVTGGKSFGVKDQTTATEERARSFMLIFDHDVFRQSLSTFKSFYRSPD